MYILIPGKPYEIQNGQPIMQKVPLNHPAIGKMPLKSLSCLVLPYPVPPSLKNINPCSLTRYLKFDMREESFSAKLVDKSEVSYSYCRWWESLTRFPPPDRSGCRRRTWRIPPRTGTGRSRPGRTGPGPRGRWWREQAGRGTRSANLSNMKTSPFKSRGNILLRVKQIFLVNFD